MPRFQFNLERVLRHKERHERQAELRQQQALGQLRAVEMEIAVCQRRLDDSAAALQGKLGRSLDLSAWLASYREAERLARELAAAEARRLRALQALQEAAAGRRKKALEAEALRHLRRRHKQKHEESAARAEQVALDEISLRRWTGAADEVEPSKDVTP
jgi:flagellar biosynthesis chaperone FliJ